MRRTWAKGEREEETVEVFELNLELKVLTLIPKALKDKDTLDLKDGLVRRGVSTKTGRASFCPRTTTKVDEVEAEGARGGVGSSLSSRAWCLMGWEGTP